MARPMPTSINCPNCGYQFTALLEQLLDLSVDPTAKDRLLSGGVNNVTCPNCGWNGQVGTPLMYHDPEKKLAIVHVPMQIDMSTEDRERLIGDLTNAVMRNLPEDAPKGYLLQPQTALTLQGLVEQVLEADGITREMLDRERQKITVINELASANAAERAALLEEHADLIDETFIELLSAAAQNASQTEDQRTALRLLNARSHLLETTEAGRAVQARELATREAVEALQARANQQGQITREDFVDIVVEMAENPYQVEALGRVGGQLLDYQTFALLTNRVDAEQNADRRAQIAEARETLLQIAAEMEQQSRAVVEQAMDTLRTLLNAQDIPAAVQANLNRIDETFLQVLQVNLEEARKANNVEVSSRLKQIRDEVLALIEQAAPPEIQLINQLLSVQEEEDALSLLRDNADQVTPQLVEVMDQLIQQLEAAGNPVAAERLEVLRNNATRMLQ